MTGATISRYGSAVPSVFALAGVDENSATSAVGWTFAKSPNFRRNFIKALLPSSRTNIEEIRVDLQRHGGQKGFTDIELSGPNFHVIIEAKKGLDLPGTSQLEQYAARIGSATEKLLVSISASPAYYAKRILPAQVRGIPVVHRSWRDTLSIVHEANREASSPIEKIWLRELEQHLGDYVSTRRITDNTVYVVSLGEEVIHAPSGYTWIDVVKDGFYFHPVGNGWPTEPPNYMGFRFDARLQSVHHIREWQIPGNLRDINPKWPDDTEHFVYTLGPPMIPAKIVKSGPIWQMRSYAALDLLLSGECGTLKEAFAETKKRLKDS